MAADGAGAIGPVSVRYAAQIRELLYAQAVQRMAADQEAARAKTDSDRAAKDEAVAKADHIRLPLEARVQVPEPAPRAAPVATIQVAETKTPPVTTGPAQLIDIQA